MDSQQIAKQVDWLDSERRKDKQELAALQERLAAQAAENTALNRRLTQLESDLTAAQTQIQRLNKIDEILAGYRKEMARQVSEMEKRWAEAEKEGERLRKVEREGLTKSLAELRKSAEAGARLERDMTARKEEEARIARIVAEAQKKIAEFSKLIDDRSRAVTLVEEGRRQDAKRIADLQAEASELRKRIDENRSKLDVVADGGRRTDGRLTELVSSEAERRLAQSQWVEAQAVAQAERDRAFNEVRAGVERAVQAVEEYGQRVAQYDESHREVKRAADEFRQATELLERRMNEAAEIQRLAEERLRQDWAAFLADDQKRWTTHMLLRDEQWREHDRLNTKHVERVELLEEQAGEALDTVRHLQAVDAQRLQALMAMLRDMLAEHEQSFAKAR